MSYLTLDPSWTAPSSCLASTAYYYMVVETYSGGIIFSEMFGAPTPLMLSADPTGPCIPPSFTTDTPYMTDGPCPAGYTEACATKAVFSGTPASSVTCCPSAFKFNCHGETYGCVAKASSGEVWTGTRTDIATTPNTQMPETHTAAAGEPMWAWGIKFIRTPPATGSPTSTAQETGAAGTRGTMASVPTAGITSLATTGAARPTGAGAEAAPAGISPGTAAGVGVGAAAGVVLVALGAWLLYRRRRHRRQSQSQPPVQPPYYAPGSYPPHEYYAQPPYPQHKAEMGPRGRAEVPVEMQ